MELSEVIEFMRAQRMMTLSTVHTDGRPQAAVVQFAVLPDDQLLVATSSSSRKYQNLQVDDRVACVIGWDDRITVQLEGTIEIIPDGDVSRARETYLDQNPKANKIISQPDNVWLRITPTWLRYADYGSYPWKLQEFNL